MDISKEIFEKEAGICKKHFQDKDGCAWGKCKDCGVLPLLVKLYESRIVEDENAVKELKNEIFGMKIL